ncbi:pyrimidine 5'-nucleotidase [Aspergillus ustus]|uniref:Pyrimidine 5'-nucleotidase n=1 Tax=Aspergillus ustus TaxID=40382 RepID=A0A0C1E1N0_ASPUT|nr:pyrimidine 5'-nucleotidase [Aspergillus ustus]
MQYGSCSYHGDAQMAADTPSLLAVGVGVSDNIVVYLAVWGSAPPDGRRHDRRGPQDRYLHTGSDGVLSSDSVFPAALLPLHTSPSADVRNDPSPETPAADNRWGMEQRSESSERMLLPLAYVHAYCAAISIFILKSLLVGDRWRPWNSMRMAQDLYSSSTLTIVYIPDVSLNIHGKMIGLIDQFIAKHLSLNAQDATLLQQKYYKDYGLVLEGLTRHHKIDPMAFNREVDDALPLDSIVSPDQGLKTLLSHLDTTKVKPWLLTNAYSSHAQRVLRLLDLEGFFEGITYCDYGSLPLVCKPDQEMYARAEREAGVAPGKPCYFVDDSHLNCKHAHARGWVTAHLVESDLELEPPLPPACGYVISSLGELVGHFPHLFKSEIGDGVKLGLIPRRASA